MRKTLVHLAAAALLCMPALVHAQAAGGPARHSFFGPGQGAPGAPEFGPGARGFAPGRGLQRRQRGMLMRQRWAALGLSDTQRQRLRDLRDAHQRQAIEQRAQLALARLDLQKLMRADRPDQEAVNAQIDRIARLRAEQMKSAFELRLRAQSVLTDEQLRQLKSSAPGRNARGEM